MASCSESARVEKLINNMIQKEVDFSSVDHGIINGEYVAAEIPRHSSKLVIYLDSVSCSPCVISRLNELERFFDISEVSGGAFIPVFIFTLSEKYDLAAITKSLSYNKVKYPIIYVDSGREFLSNNKFIPIEQKYHCFLVDKDDKIVLVGNPISSDSIWNKYITTIEQMIEGQSLSLNNQ